MPWRSKNPLQTGHFCRVLIIVIGKTKKIKQKKNNFRDLKKKKDMHKKMPSLGIHAEYEGSVIAGKYITHISWHTLIMTHVMFAHTKATEAFKNVQIVLL